MTASPSIVRVRHPEEVAAEAARRFVACAAEAVERRGRFVVALSGGSTPRLLHRLLVQPPLASAVDWERTTVLFGDERCVPPDHEDSNYRMARETLFDRVPLPAWRIHRMRGEAEPETAATEYRERLTALFAGQAPRIDLVLLGMGPDGHTASLFPGTRALVEERHTVLANHVPQLDGWRITLTYPALNAARHVLFLITGAAKAPAFAEAFEGRRHAEVHPAERVAPVDGTLTVLVDAAAAAG